jgi:hypothetical protein
MQGRTCGHDLEANRVAVDSELSRVRLSGINAEADGTLVGVHKTAPPAHTHTQPAAAFV